MGAAVRLVILAVCGWGWFDESAKFEAQIRASVWRLSGILGRSYAVLGAPSLSERAFQTDQPSPTKRGASSAQHQCRSGQSERCAACDGIEPVRSVTRHVTSAFSCNASRVYKRMRESGTKLCNASPGIGSAIDNLARGNWCHVLTFSLKSGLGYLRLRLWGCGCLR